MPGVKAELTNRSLIADLGGAARAAASRFEADALAVAQCEALGSGGLELVPTTGIVEALRAVKDEERDREIRARRARRRPRLPSR